MVNDRQVYRRLEPIHVMLGLLVVVGAVIEAVIGTGGGRARAASLVLFLDALAVVYFLGPAGAVVVTPQLVLVNNVFVRHLIPREAVEGVTESRSSARLRAAGRTFRVSAFNDVLYSRSGRIGTPATSRKVRRVLLMMEEVPASAPSGEPVRSHIRYLHTLLATATVVSLILAVLYLADRAPS
jgi:hypothetical protein